MKIFHVTLTLMLATTVFVACKKSDDNASNSPSHTGEVTTVAGSSTAGNANGTGTAATFSTPTGVTVDGSGNLYVADEQNAIIRKITPAGVVTTFAGSGVQATGNGTGTSSSFVFPLGIAVDASGNVYIGDEGAHNVRKITAATVVTTLAGSSTSGFVNATGTAASFHTPQGLAVDADGNVYVADAGNNCIRKITSAGVVTTFAGSSTSGHDDATGTAATFFSPSAVALDGSGNLYVADKTNNIIRKITSAGVVTTLAGTSGVTGSANGTGSAASFNNPRGIAADQSGNVYVSDTGNNLIRKITPAGVVTTLAGSGSSGSANGIGTAASFNSPTGITVDGSGHVYVADASNNLIRRID
ncbi:MAG: hypothetical protein JWM14_228 [Chitinophagaceae bacterium]|nr:hypothetical protein [Chitinophagaceae bacterium]